MKTMPEQTDSKKKALRIHLRETMEAIPPEERHERSIRACTRLAETPVYARADVIMVFLSLPTEVDTTPLVLQAWRDGKRILAPKVSWEQRRMLPIEIQSLSDNISESQWGIREPAQGMPIPMASIDLVIVPGLGFDQEGNRIGRGRGFYDQFLAHEGWEGLACGLALEDQVVDHVPTHEHDVRVDMLVTDEMIRTFSSHPAC